MRYTSLPIEPGRSRRVQHGFHHVAAGLGVEQRESLCRGIVFFLLLTLSCMLIVYAPLVWGEPDWAAAGVKPVSAGSSPALGLR